jgi:undecaprenyl diphosphate synthase
MMLCSNEESNICHKLPLPKHVALIMDGNRRWSQEHSYPSFYGHARGAEKLQEIVIAATELGISTLTAYAFSTENWQRSISEIDTLFELFQETLKTQAEIMIRYGVRFHWLGVPDGLPKALLDVLQYVTEVTAHGSKLELILAINYGGRSEICRAVTKIATACLSGELSIQQISEEVVASYLDLGSLSPPDLLIRTSGQHRLSNFLLWHVAYSEFIFTETLWPDFTKEEFFSLIELYQNRQRRLGT